MPIRRANDGPCGPVVVWAVTCVLWGVAAAGAVAVLPSEITAFSASPAGARIPIGWRETRLPKAERLTAYEIVEDEGTRVLRANADASMSGLTHPLAADANRTPNLSWRWKVSSVVERARAGTKSGDDFAARVYVLFDADLSRLSLFARAKLKVARALYGDAVPAAGLCYVWDGKLTPGTTFWSPYTDRVRMIVVTSGPEAAGRWVDVRRDVAADYRAAFGEPVPPISGVAVATDTDNTGDRLTAWYGDLRFEPRP